MNYATAKKLKDAGFEQRQWPETLFYLDKDTVGVWGSFRTSVFTEKGGMVSSSDFVKRPTLSELIEALGDYFISIVRMADNEWVVTGGVVLDRKFMENGRVTASTAEEAAAILWLTVNNKA